MELPSKAAHKFLSAWTVIILCVLLLLMRLMMPIGTHILTWDIFGYYLYLPARFIYHDLALHDITWLRHIYDQYQPSGTLYQINELPNGDHAMRYTIGPAVLSLPFFFIAHLWAKMSGSYPADGFSYPYQFMHAMAALFYTLIGLYYTRKFLLRFFNDRLTALLLVLVVLGTNYIQLTTDKNTLPHNYLFTLYAVLLYYTVKWHDHPKTRYACLVGLTLGLIFITRPNEVIIGLIPLLWGVYDTNSLKLKLQLLRKRLKHILLGGFFFTAGVSPLLLYWKIYTGSWLYPSYQDPGVGFEFLHPFTLEFLFSFRKGWFVYTPIMFFACIGFFQLYKRNKDAFWAISVFSILNLYIASSWSYWWYGAASYSARAIVPAYVIFALALGYFLNGLQKNRLLQTSFIAFFGLLCILNLFNFRQAYTGILDGDRMTMAYYFRSFGRLWVSDEDKKLMLVNRSYTEAEALSKADEKDLRHVFLVKENFDDMPADPKSPYSDSIAHSGKYSFRLDSNTPFSPLFIDRTYPDLTDQEYAWLRISAWFFIPQDSTAELPMLVVAFHHNNRPYKYRSRKPFFQPQDRGKWVYYSFDYQTPEVRCLDDRVRVYFWYTGKKPVYVDDLRIEKFEPNL